MGDFNYGGSILQAYLKKRELDQQATQIAQSHEDAQNLLQYHLKALAQETQNQKDDLTLRSLAAKKDMQSTVNNLYGFHGAPGQPVSSFGQPQVSEGNFQTDSSGQLTTGAPNIGVTPEQSWQKDIPELAPLRSILGPTGSQVTVDPNYQDLMAKAGLAQAQTAATAAGLKTGAEEEAKVPGLIKVQQTIAQGRKDVAQQTADAAWDRLVRGDADKKDIAGAANSTKLQYGRIINAGKLAAAQVSAKKAGLSDSDLIGPMMDFATGVRKPTSSKQDIAASNAMVNSGIAKLDPVDAQESKSVMDIMDAMDSADKYADTLGPSKMSNIIGSGIINNPTSPVKSFSDALANKVNPDQKKYYDEMNSNLAGVTTTLSGLKRLNIPDLGLQKEGLTLPGDDPATGHGKNAIIRGKALNRVWNKSLGSLPVDQKVLNMEKTLGGVSGMVNKFGGDIIPDPNTKTYKYSGKVIPNPHYDAKAPFDPTNIKSMKYLPIVSETSGGQYQMWDPAQQKYFILRDVNPITGATKTSSQPDEDEDEEE